MCETKENKVNIVSFELSPEWDNIAKSYVNNPESRKRSTYDLIRLINNVDSRTSIAINGSWGSGKTFYVKQAKLLMDCYNASLNIKYIDKKLKDKVKNNQNSANFKFIQENPLISFYYDAWINDNNEDPVLSLIYSIVSDCSLNYNNGMEILPILDYFSQIIDCFNITPIKVKSLIEFIKSYKKKKNEKDILKEIKNKIEIKNKVNSIFASILKGKPKNSRLVIFIDELDRCSPLFAVKLLERIKHYFDNDKITFVFSVNLEALSSTVKKVYGENFNADKYLERFFDLVIPMPEFDMEFYCESIMFNDTLGDSKKIIKTITKNLNLNMREVSKFMRYSNAFKDYFNVLTSSKNEDYLDAICYSYKLLILPILGLISKNISNKDMLLSGNGYEIFFNLVENIDEFKYLSEKLYKNSRLNFEGGFDFTEMVSIIYDSFVKEYETSGASTIPKFSGLKHIFRKAIDFPEALSNSFEPLVNETNE